MKNKQKEDQGKKQVDILKTLKPKELEAIEVKSDGNEKHLKYKEVFNELSNETSGEIYSISKEINFKNLNYNIKGSNTAPINFTEFRDQIYIYNEIKNGKISIKKLKKIKNNLKQN